MTATEADAQVRAAVRLGRFNVSPHAQKRMTQRQVRLEDIRSAVLTASALPVWQESERSWMFRGKDVDRDDLTVCVRINHVVEVATVF